MYFFNEDLKNMSDIELSTGLKAIEIELSRRERENCAKAIENFKIAFYALKDAGVEVSGIAEDYGRHIFNSWDDFYFD